MKIKFKLNGELKTAEIVSYMTLLEVLRDTFGLTGTKCGCGNGECGACTVIMNGHPVRSCLILGVEADGSEIFTIESVSANGLSDLQKAFLEEGAVQCGFCTPGFIMAGEALFKRTQNPTDEEIKIALGGHLCRCTGYDAIFKAFKKVKVKKTL
ncbi:MAG TPA: (2Fe-2S)-binding protein [Elusimicrobia bacterium]|nr:(2Fe-2S)-binding protein [Elusimicrobiota bacterium]